MIHPGGVDQVSGHLPIKENAIPDRTAADSTRLANNKSPEKNQTALVAVDVVAVSLAGWFIIVAIRGSVERTFGLCGGLGTDVTGHRHRHDKDFAVADLSFATGSRR